MMNLNIKLDESPKHSEVSSSVTWSNCDELLSAGDDHQILLWNLASNETTLAIQLSPDFYPISIQWQKGTGLSASRKTNELLLVTGSDGTFHLYGKGNRLEKSVQAHQGAIINAAWSPNGSEILTAGEDGYIRIWSRAGMLRSILAQHNMAIYAATWAPDGQSVLYGLDKTLIVRGTSGGNTSRPFEWKAHEGLILCTAWSSAVNLIVSGAEDCRYRVWHPDGRCVFTSGPLEYPVMSLSWSFSGDLFAVGGCNFVRLCDRFGWTHCTENPKFGSVYAMEWSPDGTQFAGATSEGHIFLANVIHRSCIWKNVEALLSSQNTVSITEFKSNTRDSLEFQERVIQLSMNHGYLIVVLPTQIYIYNVGSIPTHVLCDLKEANSIYMVLQSKRNFIVCGHVGITSRSYDGRQLAHIKWPGMQSEMLNTRTTSLAEDMVALIDQTDRRLIRVYDSHSGRLLLEERTALDVIQVSLAQNEMSGPTERQLAYLDKSFDLFLTAIKRQGKAERSQKLGTGTISIIWHHEAPMLASIWESKVRVYYFPQVLFIDPTLLEHTTEEHDIGDAGSCPELVSYTQSYIRLRKADGTLLCTTGNYFVPQLYNFMSDGNFGKARRLCRYINDQKLWGVLAGLASSRGDLETAEICFAQIGHYDKVEFLGSIKKIPDEVVKKAHRELFIGGMSKGDDVLVKSGRLTEAIELNAICMNWDRALELSLKGGDVQALLGKRQEFLDSIGVDEFLPHWIELNEIKGQGSTD